MMRIVKLRMAVLLTMLPTLTGCGDDLQKTFDQKAAHGHIGGQPHEIRVGETLLRIPPEVKYKPFTSGEVIKGYAEALTLGISYPDIHSKSMFNSVVIRLRGGGYEVPEIWDKRFLKKEWDRIIERKEYGLLEYHAPQVNYAWGYIVYTPVDDGIRTPKGSIIRYRCAGNKNGVVSCLSGFTLAEELYVEYKLTPVLLPHWERVHSDVVTYVENLIVK